MSRRIKSEEKKLCSFQASILDLEDYKKFTKEIDLSFTNLINEALKFAINEKTEEFKKYIDSKYE